MPFTVQELPETATYRDSQILKSDGARCPLCGARLEDAGGGGCGGRGRRKRCEPCKATFTQESGGARPSDEEETWLMRRDA